MSCVESGRKCTSECVLEEEEEEFRRDVELKWVFSCYLWELGATLRGRVFQGGSPAKEGGSSLGDGDPADT